MALVSEILYRVSTLLLDMKPQFTRWKERELVLWINDGQRAIAKYVPFAYARLDAVKLVPGSRQCIANIPAIRLIPGDGSTAVAMRGVFINDIVRNMGTDGLTPGAVISVIPRGIQDSLDGGWHKKDGAGVVEHFAFDPRMPQYFYAINPVSATIETWVEISYLALPTELPAPALNTSDTLYGVDGAQAATGITLDDTYLDDLVNYVCARAFMKDAEYAANQANVGMYSQMFVSSLNAHVQMMTGSNPNISFLPFAPNPIGAAK